MKQVTPLIVFLLMISVGCAKKAETEKINLDSDEALEELLTDATEETTAPTAPNALDSTLTANPPVQPGSPEAGIEASVPENPTNEQIQQALKNAGLYDGKIDGSIGPKSKEAIRNFQTQNNLSADGKVGPKTWAVLGPYLSKTPVAPDPSAAQTTAD